MYLLKQLLKCSLYEIGIKVWDENSSLLYLDLLSIHVMKGG